ncbi:MAG: putative metal-dependent hydrolase [Bacteroidetes bacterium]|nr:putative metal-dependent hydrolase [Rhodothermia bacterium]MCS7156021.1 putative metal-dependent hydrolase [Bacteroidota bacterium]MCX7907709.1 putative metal-dependent hydrolase [Bacteroidota bacterium]MDW8137838.1 putative metal-dependent hydrolase [Bacteroidota bacterium]MDW8286311.1 putative metal-dependent hydrolase [Bacteroidota bacterium]
MSETLWDARRYPIGPFRYAPPASREERRERIEELAAFPAMLGRTLQRVSKSDWARSYRSGGWTVRQLVHHLADSHLNAFVRFKLALTAEQPQITPIEEARWAELADVTQVDPWVSVRLLEALHIRWVSLLRAMAEEDFSRTYWHPAQGRAVTLEEALALYDWHGRHHLAHIELALEGLL